MKRRGFTLIELLIVVLIIAILAAIAVPNFLEFQVRAKISRVKSDMRSMATAIEAYAVDWDMVPLGEYEIGEVGAGGISGLTTFEEKAFAAQSRLTTPIAYISTILKDVFKEGAGQGGGIYHDDDLLTYQSYTWANGYYGFMKGTGYYWSLHSLGPSRDNAEAGNVGRMLLGLDWDQAQRLTPYDPTNGTVSFGVVCRTNKGEFINGPYK